MDHYSSNQWADLVLGKAPDDVGATNLHLETCPICIDAYQFWRRLAAAVELDTKYRIPAGVLRHLERAFTISAKPGSKFLFPRLSFDSLWELHPIGVRALSPAADRTLVFQTNDLELRLRIEKRLNPERLWLDGQLTGRKDPGRDFEHLRTRMAEKDIPLAESFTNAFGEFQFEFKPVPEIELSIELGSEGVITIPLDPLSPDSSEASA